MLVGQRRMHTTPLFRSHGMQLPSESLPVGPSLHHEATLSAPRAVMREAKEGKRLRPPVTARLTTFGREPAEFDEARFVFVERQAKRGEALPKGDYHLPRVRLVLEAHHEVSRPGEFHPQALAEPYMNVSAHTAPITQPPAVGPKGASGQTTAAPDRPHPRANAQRDDDAGGDVCISAWPSGPEGR